jgi:hypothetical protein
MMQLITERSGNGVIARLYECDCPLPSCSRQWLICSVEGAHSMLAITVATSTEPDVLRESMVTMAANEENQYGVTVAEVIETGMALIGMRWEDLEASADAAGLQLAAWSRLPGWMEQQARGLLWSCRGVTFGNDLTRVPRALWALQAAYVPDAPASPAEVFSRDRMLVLP